MTNDLKFLNSAVQRFFWILFVSVSKFDKLPLAVIMSCQTWHTKHTHMGLLSLPRRFLKMSNESITLTKEMSMSRGLYNGSRGFYDSTSESDEMCNGAMWLYRATNDSTYLDYARTLADFNVPWSYDWDNKQGNIDFIQTERTEMYILLKCHSIFQMLRQWTIIHW